MQFLLESIGIPLVYRKCMYNKFAKDPEDLKEQFKEDFKKDNIRMSFCVFNDKIIFEI